MNGFHLPEDQLPRFFPLPEKLLNEDLTLAEFKVYLVLLRRSFLSARNPRWVDAEGRVYLYYPIKDLARVLNRGETCVKSALKALEEKDLILRVRQGAGMPNRIYVKFPAEEDPYDPVTDDPCGLWTDALCDPGAVTPCGPRRDGKATPSKIERRERKDREREEEKGGPSPAEAQGADFSEDGGNGKRPCLPLGAGGTKGRMRGSPRRRRRRENCSSPLKPALDWFKMALSKNGRENL